MEAAPGVVGRNGPPRNDAPAQPHTERGSNIALDHEGPPPGVAMRCPAFRLSGKRNDPKEQRGPNEYKTEHQGKLPGKALQVAEFYPQQGAFQIYCGHQRA